MELEARRGRVIRVWRVTVCVTVLLSCFGCTHTVKFFDDGRMSRQELATLEYRARTVLKINGQEPVKDLNGFVHHVRVQLVPQEYALGWTEQSREYTFVYNGAGILNAQAGRHYAVRQSFLPGATRVTSIDNSAKYFSTQVMDYATWIEDADTHEVVVGTRPAWVDTVTVRPQIVFEGGPGVQ